MTHAVEPITDQAKHADATPAAVTPVVAPDASSPVVPVAPKRGRGLKLPPVVFIPLIAILVAAGGWLVYRQIFAIPKVDLSQYESPDSPTMGLRRQLNSAAGNPASGVITRNNGGDVQLPGARVRFVKAGDNWNIDPSFTDPRALGNTDRTVQFARFTAVSDKAAAQKAKVTDEQIEKLKKIVFPRMVISDADKAKLLDLWKRYQAAGDTDKPKVEKELTDAFRQVANDAIAPTQKAVEAAGKDVRAILSQPQIDTLRAEQQQQRGPRNNPAPRNRG